jgi:hypothetical protein
MTEVKSVSKLIKQTVFLIHANTSDSKTRVLLDAMAMVETHKKWSVLSIFLGYLGFAVRLPFRLGCHMSVAVAPPLITK